MNTSAAIHVLRDLTDAACPDHNSGAAAISCPCDAHAAFNQVVTFRYGATLALGLTP